MSIFSRTENTAVAHALDVPPMDAAVPRELVTATFAAG